MCQVYFHLFFSHRERVWFDKLVDLLDEFDKLPGASTASVKTDGSADKTPVVTYLSSGLSESKVVGP